MIAQGKVGTVSFFRDLLNAHPCETDISALRDVHDTLIGS